MKKKLTALLAGVAMVILAGVGGCSNNDEAAKPLVIPHTVTQAVPDVVAMEDRTADEGALGMVDEVPQNLGQTHGIRNAPTIHGFGYNLGQLVHDRWFEPTKIVDMSVTTSSFTVECPKRLELPKNVGGVAKLRITFVGAYSPSKLWEKEFHREVALWDRGTNKVSSVEVRRGVRVVLAQYRDSACMSVEKKTASEILRDPTLPAVGGIPFVEHLGKRLKKEQPEWNMRMHSVLVHLDEDSVLRIGSEALRPVAPVARPKPVAKKPAPIQEAPKPPCGCKTS